MAVTPESINAARARTRHHVATTPTLYSLALSDATGAQIFVKYENFPYTGSFKPRCAICATEGANVIDVSHRRLGLDLAAGAARFDITIEMRDKNHANQIVERIRAVGFTLDVHEP